MGPAQSAFTTGGQPINAAEVSRFLFQKDCMWKYSIFIASIDVDQAFGHLGAR